MFDLEKLQDEDDEHEIILDQDIKNEISSEKMELYSNLKNDEKNGYYLNLYPIQNRLDIKENTGFSALCLSRNTHFLDISIYSYVPASTLNSLDSTEAVGNCMLSEPYVYRYTLNLNRLFKKDITSINPINKNTYVEHKPMDVTKFNTTFTSMRCCAAVKRDIYEKYICVSVKNNGINTLEKAYLPFDSFLSAKALATKAVPVKRLDYSKNKNIFLTVVCQKISSKYWTNEVFPELYIITIYDKVLSKFTETHTNNQQKKMLEYLSVKKGTPNSARDDFFVKGVSSKVLRQIAPNEAQCDLSLIPEEKTFTKDHLSSSSTQYDVEQRLEKKIPAQNSPKYQRNIKNLVLDYRACSSNILQYVVQDENISVFESSTNKAPCLIVKENNAIVIIDENQAVCHRFCSLS